MNLIDKYLTEGRKIPNFKKFKEELEFESIDGTYEYDLSGNKEDKAMTKRVGIPLKGNNFSAKETYDILKKSLAAGKKGDKTAQEFASSILFELGFGDTMNWII